MYVPFSIPYVREGQKAQKMALSFGGDKGGFRYPWHLLKNITPPTN